MKKATKTSPKQSKTKVVKSKSGAAAIAASKSPAAVTTPTSLNAAQQAAYMSAPATGKPDLEAEAKRGTPQITPPRSAQSFTVKRSDGKVAALPMHSLKPVLQNETRPYTIQFHRGLPSDKVKVDVEGLYHVAADGSVTQDAAKVQPVAEKPAATPKADKVKAPSDGWPANEFDRANWEEIIKGGTKEEVAARVAKRFADVKDEPTRKYRTNPANSLKYYEDYVKELKAAGKLPK